MPQHLAWTSLAIIEHWVCVVSYLDRVVTKYVSKAARDMKYNRNSRPPLPQVVGTNVTLGLTQ